MNAKQARDLKVGDWVSAHFGIHRKSCQVVAIEWPKFELQAIDYRGEFFYRTRTYRSLWRCEAPNATNMVGSPSWLIWPE
jgi:hypothetical protein